MNQQQTIRVPLVDHTEDFGTLKLWQAKGWRITHRSGDEYIATKQVRIPRNLS